MRYRTCLIDSHNLLSLSACEFKAPPVLLPDRPSYGLVPSTTGKPRLYSVRDIGRSEMVTEHPVQVIPARQVSSLRRAGLEDLCFDWDGDRYAVALGAGAFIGHSSDPNCFWTADHSHRTIAIRPRRPIFAGEELTIDYSTDMRRPCATRDRCEVRQLAAEQLPKPELPKALVTSDMSYGRTLIAVRNIHKGENIGEAPVRVVSNRQVGEFARVLSLVDLAHTWEKGLSAVVLGIPALVNHSYAANAFYKTNLRRRTISLVAHKDIPSGYEITMNYNGHPNDQSPLDWKSTERYAPLVVALR